MNTDALFAYLPIKIFVSHNPLIVMEGLLQNWCIAFQNPVKYKTKTKQCKFRLLFRTVNYSARPCEGICRNAYAMRASYIKSNIV